MARSTEQDLQKLTNPFDPNLRAKLGTLGKHDTSWPRRFLHEIQEISQAGLGCINGSG